MTSETYLCQISTRGYFASSVEQVICYREVELMGRSKVRMSGQSHHLTDALSHLRLVAVNGTLRTSRLVWSERAPIQTAHCIPSQGSALRAKLSVRTVTTAAVDSNHRGDGPFFTSHPWFVCSRGIVLFGGHSLLSLTLSSQGTSPFAPGVKSPGQS